MFAQLYPRIDETHLIVALPSGLVLAAWAARRVAHGWARTLGVPARWLVNATAGIGVALVAVAATPGLRTVLDLRDGVGVASARVPVRLETTHASDIRALNALLEWLRQRLEPGEGLFGFPAVGLVPFALGHPSVTRHDYWYAGRPDHLEEAEVVRRLERLAPRFVVTVNRNVGFFSNSARYYFVLRAFVRERYVLAARFGRYDVLMRRDLDPGTPRIEAFDEGVRDDAELIARLAEPLHESRRAAMRAFLERVGSADDVAPLAAALATDERTLILLLRAMAEAPDLRVVPFLAQMFETGSWRVRAEAGVALNYMALYAAEHRYLFGATDADTTVTPAQLVGLVDLPTVRRWLGDRHARFVAGAFAAWVVVSANDAEAAPELEAIVATLPRIPYLRLTAAYGLVRGGRIDYLCTLVGFLGDGRHDYQDAVPSLLIDEAVAHPTELARCLAAELDEPRALGRETAAWTAGAVGLPAVAPALRTALGDAEWRVRSAAAWALGRLRDDAARPALAALAHDPEPRTRAFAADALGRLGADAP
jgi:HEAT repeat protein